MSTQYKHIQYHTQYKHYSKQHVMYNTLNRQRAHIPNTTHTIQYILNAHILNIMHSTYNIQHTATYRPHTHNLTWHIYSLQHTTAHYNTEYNIDHIQNTTMHATFHTPHTLHTERNTVSPGRKRPGHTPQPTSESRWFLSLAPSLLLPRVPISSQGDLPPPSPPPSLLPDFLLHRVLSWLLSCSTDHVLSLLYRRNKVQTDTFAPHGGQTKARTPVRQTPHTKPCPHSLSSPDAPAPPPHPPFVLLESCRVGWPSERTKAGSVLRASSPSPRA